MDIFSARDEIESFQRTYIETADLECAAWSPVEFKIHTQMNAYQAAFAGRFSERAPDAWNDLKFLTPVAIQWFAERFGALTGTGSPSAALEASKYDRVLQHGIHVWASRYGIDVPWIHSTAFLTLRAFAFIAPFRYPEPNTLLYDSFPTLVVADGEVELGTSTLRVTPFSSVTVCADQGLQEWDTLVESKTQFRNRMIDAFTKELDEQLSLVNSPLLAEDRDVKSHWLDITIDRYARHMSIRALASIHRMSRPGVSKAIEAVRRMLEFEKLPETWGATKPQRWELHAT